MSRHFKPFALLLVGLLAASAAGARDYDFFENGDQVYYQGQRREIEKIAPPRFYLPKALSAFANGHRSISAEYLEKAAAGFDYFEQRAAGEDRRQLKIAGRALEKLADSVRRGEIEITTLDRAVKDAQRVLDGEAVMRTEPAAPESEA